MNNNMVRDVRCKVCGNSVEKVSYALCQKLFDKKTKKILCLSCLSNELDVEQEELLEKADEFKRSGCTLFN